MSVTIKEAAKILSCLEDSEIKNQLIEKLRLRFYKQGRWRRIPEQDLDDVVNDGLERVLCKIDQFRGDGEFHHWVTVLFSHICVDYFRRRKVRSCITSFNYSKVEGNIETDSEILEAVPSKSDDPSKLTDDRRSLQQVMLILDRVITEVASRHRKMERDVEIAHLAFREFLEPSEILQTLVGKYPNLTANAVRIVIYQFRVALRKAIE